MAFLAGGRRLPRVVPWLALAVTLLVTAGCGAPEYTYVTNSEDRTYLRVPSSWRPIDGRALQTAIGIDPSVDAEEAGFWLEGYDADATPSADHLLGQHAEAPALFVGVQEIPAGARGQISLDLMRDIFWPVSETARDRNAQNPATPYSGFGLLSDDVLTPGDGLRGVHSVFQYRILGGPTQIIDQTVYTNDDASKVYMFYVRCSSDCYEQRQKEINGVVSSFTVRESS
jgi:hypothetical protein